MITVVYCTRETNPKHTEHLISTSGLHKNIEVIEIINNGESLTKAYNRGLEQAKNDIVVFCHDDIIIESKGWGKKLIKHFDETDFGVLGLAGSTGLGEDGKWWSNHNLMVGIVNHQHNGKKWESRYSGDFGDKVIETVNVDGLFFAIKKDRLKYGFNENVEGFHFYDIDFTYGNHVNGCKVGVMFNIRVTHLSIGQTNDQWEENRIKFSESWKDNLPTILTPPIFFKDNVGKIKKEPKVSLIIPSKNNWGLLKKCLLSIINKSNYENLDVIVADTGSEDSEIVNIEEFISDNEKNINLKLVRYDYYNFAKINNDVVKNHIKGDTELLLFCNNDIELINDAITILVSHYLKNKGSVGTLGARLHFENKTIQHAGILSTFLVNSKVLNVSHHGLYTNYRYEENPRNVMGNTGAFLLINKHLFNSIGGFNENYLECFEDVELNLQTILKGKKNVIVSDAVCYHYESSTRGKNEEKNKNEVNDYTQKLAPFIFKHIEQFKKYITPINR